MKDPLAFCVQVRLYNYNGQTETRDILLSVLLIHRQEFMADPGRRNRGAEGSYYVIVEERMRTFINSLDSGNTPFLEELEQEALAASVPIIRREMQSFIKVLLAVKKPGQHSGGGDSRRLLHTSYV